MNKGGRDMFNGKYSKTLTVILVIVIIAILVVGIYQIKKRVLNKKI